MELTEALLNRRAVRDYSDEKLNRPLIEGLIKAATLAPSAMNRQPWTFAVFEGKNEIGKLGNSAVSWLLAHQAETGIGPEGVELLKQPGFSIFYDAPALILVMAKSTAHQDAEDCCLAVENLLLAARDRGIGTCCIGLAKPWFNQESTRKKLSLPAGCPVIMPIVLGHPRRWPASHGRRLPEIAWL